MKRNVVQDKENRKLVFWVIVFVVVFVVCCILPDVKRKSNTEVITQYEVDQLTEISHFKYDKGKKDMTVISFGSSEEDMLVCIDAKGYRNFKKIIIVEEK